MGERVSICRDEDCPACGWPETFAEGTMEKGPERIGCRKCGWTKKLPKPRRIVSGTVGYGERTLVSLSSEERAKARAVYGWDNVERDIAQTTPLRVVEATVFGAGESCATRYGRSWML